MLGPYWSTSGKGWRLARSLIQLSNELEVAWPQLTRLGTIGDASHAAQGTSSDHNPFVTDPDGVGVVRAMDLGGDPEILLGLRAHLYSLGASAFPPLWPYGYLKGPDSQGNAWPIGTGWNANTGDEGHLHISVTQPNGYRPVGGAAGYLPAIDSTQSWGIANALPSPESEDEDMTAEELQEAIAKAIKPLSDDLYVLKAWVAEARPFRTYQVADTDENGARRGELWLVGQGSAEHLSDTKRPDYDEFYRLSGPFITVGSAAEVDDIVQKYTRGANGHSGT